MPSPFKLATALLSAVSAFALVELVADDFPFKGWLHWSRTEVSTPAAWGYSALPELNPRTRLYEEYGRGQWQGRYFAHCWIDRVREIDSDDGSRPMSEVAHAVRFHIYAMAPSILFVPLNISWVAWSFFFAKRLPADRLSSVRGFEVVGAAAEPEDGVQ